MHIIPGTYSACKRVPDLVNEYYTILGLLRTYLKGFSQREGSVNEHTNELEILHAEENLRSLVDLPTGSAQGE